MNMEEELIPGGEGLSHGKPSGRRRSRPLKALAQDGERSYVEGVLKQTNGAAPSKKPN